jgi:hypothetical protein
MDEKALSALVDAVNRSQYFSNIPLPAVLDNHLERLNDKYGYNKQFPDESGNIKPIVNKPVFEDEEPLTIDLNKKLKNKLKELNKRRAKVSNK